MLAAAEHLRDHTEAQPAQIILISPWLDVTMTDPRQTAIEPWGRMLGRAGLAEAGRLYAGGLDLRDPLVSPFYEDLHGLAPIAVFSSTHDLLNTDARALVDKACDAGVDVDCHEVEGVAHAYPLLPIPGGRTARDLIIQARG